MVNIQLYPTLLYEFIQVLMMILCFLSDTFDSNILLHPLFILIMLSCWIIILNYILTLTLIQSYKNKKVISKPHQYAFCARFSFVWFDWFGNCQHLFARAQQFFRLSTSNVPDYGNQSTFRISHDGGCGLPEECY